MFPPGLPGIGLIFLRASVAIALLLEAFAYRHGLSGWSQSIALVISMALFAGFLTPVAAVISIVFHALIFSTLGSGGAGVLSLTAFDSLALALLGPGAYSFDSYRFGRRMVVLPPP